jgi:hypothetical protein
MRSRLAASIVLLPLLVATAALAATAIPSTCSACRGRIEDGNRRFSAHVLDGVEPNAFDDLGCAVKWYAEQCATRALAFDSNAVVHDFATGEAVPAEKAHYVRSPAFSTPRAYGIVAFRSSEEAHKAAEQHGTKVLTYAQAFALKLP